MQNDLVVLRKELIRQLEEYFGNDLKRIDHAKLVLKYAEILLREEQADPYVVIPAALFHDIGYKVAKAKYEKLLPEHIEKEGPAVAGNILIEMGYEDANIYEICAIIAHHHRPQELESENFRVVYDADQIANLREKRDTLSREELEQRIGKLLSEAGKQLAMKELAKK